MTQLEVYLSHELQRRPLGATLPQEQFIERSLYLSVGQAALTPSSSDLSAQLLFPHGYVSSRSVSNLSEDKPDWH